MRWIDGRLEDPLAALSVLRIGILGDVVDVVSQILEDVRTRGDAALLASIHEFDSPHLGSILATEEELDIAENLLPEDDREAIRVSIDRVMRFHEAQVYYLTETMERHEGGDSRFEGVPHTSYSWSEDTDFGGSLGQRLLPVARAGIYVPGGQATYPSSVIMNVGPANVAMVPDVTITTPCRSDGSLSPAVLYAAHQMHVTRVAKVGGAAAIAALAFGTESVPRVDVIAGPGNRYVNEAKRQVWGMVGLDGYAGPSEVCVLADASTNAALAAADLITQVEHAEDNAGFLVCSDEAKAREILVEVDRQIEEAPRGTVIRQALERFGMCFLAQDEDQAVDIVNAIAPEHLSLAVADPDAWLPTIENAGCVLLGEWTPESAGDYVAGPSHTLPTSGSARFGSPVNVMNFLKFQSVIKFTRRDLEDVRSTIERFGAMEGSLPMVVAPRFGSNSALNYSFHGCPHRLCSRPTR